MTLLTTKQVADDILKMSARTLDQWAYLGKGPAFTKVGNLRRYRLEDVEAWLDGQTKGGDAA